jgi:hypothetical protein
MPQRRQQAVRWYRRGSREVRNRRTVGEVVLVTLEETRRLATTDELRRHYRERDSGWSTNHTTPMPAGATARFAEDAVYGLRRIAIAIGITIDPRASLVGVVPIKPS